MFTKHFNILTKISSTTFKLNFKCQKDREEMI